MRVGLNSVNFGNEETSFWQSWREVFASLANNPVQATATDSTIRPNFVVAYNTFNFAAAVMVARNSSSKSPNYPHLLTFPERKMITLLPHSKQPSLFQQEFSKAEKSEEITSNCGKDLAK